MPPTFEDMIRQPATQAGIAESVAAMFSHPDDWSKGVWARTDNGRALEDLFSVDRDESDAVEPASWSLAGAIRMQCGKHLGIDLADTGRFADVMCEIYCSRDGLERRHGPEGALNALMLWEDDEDRRFHSIVALAGEVADMTRRSVEALDKGAGWIAFHSEHPEAVAAWLERGGRVDRRDVIGDTPLHRAAGNFPAVRVLLEAGADANVRNYGGATPLAFASSIGNAASVAQMLASGAGLHIRDKEGCAPLHRAVGWQANAACVAILLEAGAEVAAVDRSGSTVLHMAANYDRPDIVRTLLDAGADVRAADNYGWTPLHVAAEMGCTEVVKALIEAGADPNAPDSHGSTSLHHAVSDGHANTVRALLVAGASLPVENNFGVTPLQRARDEGHDVVVGLLEEAVAGGSPAP